MTDRVKEILSWYKSDNPGVLNKLYRVLMQGKLAGTGKLIILPVDQGFEHGPARSFAPNPAGYNPHYHYQLAIDAGLNAYAAPLGFIEAGAVEYAGQIPTILKLNNHDVLHDEVDPMGAQTATVEDALRLGCVGVGYTIYPGTVDRRFLYEQLREIILEAKSVGLLAVVWSYPRGGDLSKAGETSLDVAAYAAQIACQLGAHIVKVKLPSDSLEQDAARKVYEKYDIPRKTLADRVRHVVQSAFDGRRVVIFSGGAKKDDPNAVFDEARAIRDGGGFGSIIGRNSFQRSHAEAMELFETLIKIYNGEIQ
ncbi:MAG TPA: class I fructose-bisphosphate aldolase [Anaerolineales bacterium]|nr:class I fructose-bisphosphate aldolase [Anaerolineales bacterium]